MNRVSRAYLIRHGQVEGYEEFPIYGHTDADLTEIGVLQMEQMAQRLRLLDIKAVYCSDLKRCSTGARLIASYHEASLHILPELREMHFGDWEGMTLSIIRERFPQELEKRQSDLIGYEIPGGGESISRFSDRITSVFEQILEEQKGNDFVAVVHGGVNRILLCKALGLDLPRMFNIHQDYGCLNIIDYLSDSSLVRLLNG
jgi:alpha-ribazole phosphatase/probable phosphoglycerate mutase